ncbi:hypothetical protein VOLCADRAFT_96526 [Volvox carteri f. nagariensis]|uniref:ABM domain-containing protein n=1 Tax=Volvox carteri f. nagariensis TaxID=3068 RepID=D8UAC2_VOLCA|nr:uncharacterized protein VOLCADRAFT_96526 [Volvox carteri f. nagariensis]EFJ43290.1 hypothetical protein VOLCADRAFT_96526 [Volvox carteri f. nagariensis]|eukprot:XP_002955650.1 hypothetical protein VOLCADRAFT_96526 [Volvox carteri f. nagariensis]
MRRGGEGMENRPAYMLIKYEVPPTLHDRFIEELDRHDKVLRDVKGLSFYQKTKDMDDNVMFWSYTEWDTVGDLMDHCELSNSFIGSENKIYLQKLKSTAFKDFHNWVDDNDILVEMFPLEALGDEKREYRADREGEKAATAARAAAAKDLERRRRRGREIEDWDPRDEPAHLGIRFHIMPSQEGDFLNFVEDMQKRVVKDEDENRFFVVRKFATMNHHYLIRGAWDSMEGYLDHITSKHSMNLRDPWEFQLSYRCMLDIHLCLTIVNPTAHTFFDRFAKDNNIEWEQDRSVLVFTARLRTTILLHACYMHGKPLPATNGRPHYEAATNAASCFTSFTR